MLRDFVDVCRRNDFVALETFIDKLMLEAYSANQVLQVIHTYQRIKIMSRVFRECFVFRLSFNLYIKIKIFAIIINR